jgi:hypothetical protein
MLSAASWSRIDVDMIHTSPDEKEIESAHAEATNMNHSSSHSRLSTGVCSELSVPTRPNFRARLESHADNPVALRPSSDINEPIFLLISHVPSSFLVDGKNVLPLFGPPLLSTTQHTLFVPLVTVRFWQSEHLRTFLESLLCCGCCVEYPCQLVRAAIHPARALVIGWLPCEPIFVYKSNLCMLSRAMTRSRTLLPILFPQACVIPRLARAYERACTSAQVALPQ